MADVIRGTQNLESIQYINNMDDKVTEEVSCVAESEFYFQNLNYFVNKYVFSGEYI